MDTVEAELTSAHANTASTGNFLFRMSVEEPPMHVVALG